MSNVTYKLFAEKLGGTNPESYVGDAGDIFFDPSSGQLKVSDGSTAGGKNLIDTYMLGESGNDIVALFEHFDGDLIPSDSTYSLGSEAKPWKELWVTNNSIHVGGSTISSTDGKLNFGGSPVQTHFAADSGTNADIENGETLTIAGGVGITTSVSGSTVTIDADPIQIAHTPNPSNLDTVVEVDALKFRLHANSGEGSSYYAQVGSISGTTNISASGYFVVGSSPSSSSARTFNNTNVGTSYSTLYSTDIGNNGNIAVWVIADKTHNKVYRATYMLTETSGTDKAVVIVETLI